MRKFTLIELLVVVAIIGILASMLMPSLSSARQKSKQAYCLNNVKSQGAGLIIHIDDNDEVLPGYWYWHNKVSNVLGLGNISNKPASESSVFKCPTAKEDFVGYSYKNMSYGYSFYYLGYGTRSIGGVNQQIVLGKLVDPTNMISIADSDEDDDWDSLTHKNAPYNPGIRHRNGANAVTLGGHAVWATSSALMAYDPGPHYQD